VRKHIREPFADHPRLWFMLAIARWINWPETLAELRAAGFGAWPDDMRFSPEIMAEILRRREARDEKVFTGAYTINAPAKGGSKIDHVALHVLGDLWGRADRIGRMLDGVAGAPTLRGTHGLLTGFKGFGDFMAYQIVVDLRFTRYLQNAEDVSTWAAAGPGTIRGLNRLAGRPFNRPLEQWKALHEMRGLFEWLPSESGVAMDFSDIPNVLCETDKFLRVLNNEGAPRALYRPTAEAMP
jgi:hypothetical protein